MTKLTEKTIMVTLSRHGSNDRVQHSANVLRMCFDIVDDTFGNLQEPGDKEGVLARATCVGQEGKDVMCNYHVMRSGVSLGGTSLVLTRQASLSGSN